MQIHHIGIACDDVEDCIETVQNTYDVVSVGDIIYDELQSAYLCMIETRNGPRIELIAGEQVQGLLEKGISYYHVCFTVRNMVAAIEQLTQQGAVVVSEPKPAVLFNNQKVAFLYTQTGLIELLETA